MELLKASPQRKSLLFFEERGGILSTNTVFTGGEGVFLDEDLPTSFHPYPIFGVYDHCPKVEFQSNLQN